MKTFSQFQNGSSLTRITFKRLKARISSLYLFSDFSESFVEAIAQSSLKFFKVFMDFQNFVQYEFRKFDGFTQEDFNLDQNSSSEYSFIFPSETIFLTILEVSKSSSRN